MEQTRQTKIDAGKIWQVYPDKDPDNVLFEGSRSKCKLYIAQNCPEAYKAGQIRMGKLIWEKTETPIN